VRLLTTLAVAIGLLPFGCGDGAPAPGPNGPGDLTSTFVYERSGGFIGVDEQLTIKPDGTATVRVDIGRPSASTVALTIPRRERQALAAALTRIGFAQLPEKANGPVAADAFEYAVTYAGHAVARSQADPGDDLGAVRMLAEAIVNRARAR
jgi:hypothetical protein